MIRSSMSAGLDQSIGRRTRKPRLNHEPNRCAKSSSTLRSCASLPPCLIRSSRIATSAAVPPGARLRRRSSSWRGGSTASSSACRLRGRRVLLVGLPGLPDARELGVEAAGEQAEELEPSRHRARRHRGPAPAGPAPRPTPRRGPRPAPGRGSPAFPAALVRRPPFPAGRVAERSTRARPRSAMLPISSWKKLVFILGYPSWPLG